MDEKVVGSEEKNHHHDGDVGGQPEEVPLAAEYNSENNTVNLVTMSTSSATPTNRRFLYIAASAANLASFTCGQAFGWTSPEIPLMHDQLGTNEQEEAWVGSYLPLGAAIGPFIAGFIADKIGRKKSLIVGVLPFLVAFGLCAYATSVTHFYIARFLCGLAVGCIFTVLPMYIGEISEDEVRGSLGSFMQLFIVLGLLFSFVLGPYISIKAFNLICLVAPVFFTVTFFLFIPESPYYSVLSGDNDSAEAALCKLRGKSKNSIQKELEDLKESVKEDQANKAGFMDIFKSKGLTNALLLSLSLVGIQQLSGINVVLFYAQNIFMSANKDMDPKICTIVIGVVQVLASTATPMLVDKKGKRYLLLLSAVGMGLSQCALGYFFYIKDTIGECSQLKIIPIISLITYIITYCLGFGPLPWAVMGELFPGNIKSAASTATASICWVLGFLITKYIVALNSLITEAGSFGLFGCCCLAAAAFVYYCVPETSGKSLQEIQDILSGNQPAKPNQTEMT